MNCAIMSNVMIFRSVTGFGVFMCFDSFQSVFPFKWLCIHFHALAPVMSAISCAINWYLLTYYIVSLCLYSIQHRKQSHSLRCKLLAYKSNHYIINKHERCIQIYWLQYEYIQWTLLFIEQVAIKHMYGYFNGSWMFCFS